MPGGTKPLPRSKRKSTFQDGPHRGGSMKTTRHAGPLRSSKTKPVGTQGPQLHKRQAPK